MISSFVPFLDITDGVLHKFTCPFCHSHSAVKLSYNGLNKSLHFFEGLFMCYDCGHSSYKGESFCYYSKCFSTSSPAVQLEFNF